MDYKKATVIFILTIGALIATWDVWVMHNGGLASSISQTMIMWGYKYPIFTFLMGIICGHLFWRMRDDADTKKISDFVQGNNNDQSKSGG